MTKHISKKLVTAILDELETFVGDATLHPAYSGRFMMGAKCIGFSTRNPALVSAAIIKALLANTDTDLTVADFFEDVREDSMGLKTIVYFPNITRGAASDVKLYKPKNTYKDSLDYFHLDEEVEPIKRFLLASMTPLEHEDIIDVLPASWVDRLLK